MQEPVRVEVSECANQDISISEGERTESKFICIHPFTDLADGKKVKVQIKVQSSGTDIYHSNDYSTWTKVEDVEYDDGVAKFDYQKGKNQL